VSFSTSSTLADGRALHYFDDELGVVRDGVDRRTDLAPAPPASEVRWNPLFRDYAVIAGHRQDRTYQPPADRCPLCPSRDGAPTEIPARDYDVAVFENRFPAFAGRCEVICFSSDHDRSFAELGARRVRTIVDAWADRTRALAALDSVDYVLCFENRGAEIGVTLSHPHGQIYGFPFVPTRFATAGRAAQEYRDDEGDCLQCALLRDELEAGDRIVAESEFWVCYVPFAARWPYEVRVVPRRHTPDLPDLSDAERDDLAEVYPDALRRFDRLFDTPAPYVASWQQAPVRHHRDAWHLAAEIFTIRRGPTKLKYLAGAESGAATWINDIAPEVAAARLRD
jgi:UDPglucose--hexose-1-phosphate uridylyltransferase